MSFEFVIPLSREDLRTRTAVSQYVVDEVFPVRIIPAKIQGCKSSFRSQGPRLIMHNFDTFYSVLKNFAELTPEVKEDAWDVLLKAMVAHANQMVETLEGDLDPDLRHDNVNTLKMTAYLICQFVELFEAEVCKPTDIIIGKGRKKSQRKTADVGNISWDAERDRGVRALLQMMQLNVYRLWDPPVVEEEFVNLISNTCYKLLENPNVCRDKSTKDTILQLLGVMVKKYNHGLGCSLKIIQLLQHFEHLASPLASAVQLFAEEYGVKHVTGEIMREIGRIDPSDLARDTSGTRAYATFLVELAEKIPGVMMPNISVLLALLDGESYTMRNSVLGVLGEMVIRVLSKDGLDDKQKMARDQFLDKLEDHVHDVHAFTRSRTLQIWLSIIHEKALPVARQHNLLDLVIGRIEDKSSSVRKYAMHLLTAMLRSNPFAAKLPLEELKANYEKEKETLKQMTPEPQQDPAMALKAQLEEEFSKIEKDVMKAVRAAIKKEEEETEKDEEEDEEKSTGSSDTRISEEESVDSVRDRILACLKEGQYLEAAKLLVAAQEAWPQEKLFGAASPAPEGEEEDEEEEEKEKEREMMLNMCLKAIFMGEKLAAKVIEMAAHPDKQHQDSQHNSSLVDELNKQQVLVQYLKDSMNFVSQIQRAVPLVCQLLGSKNTTDVMEAIDFFVTGFEFGVSNSMVGIRRMLVLIWSREASVKEAVVEAYKRLYLSPNSPNGSNPKARAMAVANNLMALTVGATMGDLTSLEELIVELMKSGDLDTRIMQTLWERFALKIPGTTDDDSRGALTLIGMAAGADVDIVRSNIDALVKEGLGPRAEKDFLLARDTCLVLAKLSGQKKERGTLGRAPFRLPQDHEIFQRLSHIMITGVQRLEHPFWVPMAEQAVNVIYKLAEHPDIICGHVVKQIAALIISHVTRHQAAAPDTPEEKSPEEEGDSVDSAQMVEKEDSAAETQEATEHAAGDKEDEGYNSQPSGDSQPSSEPTCASGLLTRLLSIAGHIGLRQLVHIDVAVLGEMKRRQAIQEEEADGSKRKSTSATDNNSTAKKKSSKTQEKEELTAEEEMGLTGATADDMECEYIRRVTETEIVNDPASLLSVLRPLLLAVCNNQVKYPDPELRAAATLALAKFMMVSSEFCEAHLQLLFTVLEKTPHATIRANTIIALGDLTFRFPNLIEPWTPNLYARLRDTSPKVRKNTMMVLTHLILNDMVKVKGQISELAGCIVDEDTQIANLAKLFFHELAKKGNAVYNIMPDMISRLSDPAADIEEENFRTIMRYLFSFIQKDRQVESLVEKLCHRFRASQVARQGRDLAFCLSMLSYNEKSIRKLQENFACFADKLADQDVYNSFSTIMNGAKKFAKPEAKALVEELESRLEEAHLKGVDEEETAANAFKAIQSKERRKSGKRSPGKRSPGKSPRGGRGKRGGKTPAPAKKPRKMLSEDEEEEDSEEDFHPARRGAKTKAKAKPKLSFSSDEESDEEDPAASVNLTTIDGGKEPGKKSSDTENRDPNADKNVADSPPLVSKKRVKSVNNRNRAPPPEATSTRRSNRKPSGKQS